MTPRRKPARNSRAAGREGSGPAGAGSRGERVQKVLARAGLGSRRAIEDMVVRGRVTINGRPAELGNRIDPNKDQVKVDGSTVPLLPELRHYLLNKPVGVVTTADDEAGRETALDLVDADVRLWPVGRLDMDSEGALILTNDGDLTQRLTHPRYAVPKTYLVEASGSVGNKVLKQLAGGVELEDGRTARAAVSLVERTAGGSLVEISIAEGRNREVRRMFDAVGHPVRRLVRTAIGSLGLGRLKPGTVRRIGPDEVQRLYREAGL